MAIISFRTSFLGFKKSDVNLHIEKLYQEFEEKIKSKDEEISILKNQYKDIKAKYDEINNKSDKIVEDRDRIAGVLIRAEEKAESILEETRVKAENERRIIQEIINKEKDMVYDVKKEFENLRKQLLDKINSYEEYVSKMDIDTTIIDKKLEEEEETKEYDQEIISIGSRLADISKIF